MIENIHEKLPKRISGLADLAYNLWWSWHLEARELFKVLDRNLWTITVHNPVKLLQQIPQKSLVAASLNPEFLVRYDAVMKKFHEDMITTKKWALLAHPELQNHQIAFFSLEFAIHNSLPIYAGGLGILSGDYCKEASDFGLPVVGVGFMYPQGYFHQHVNRDGWQEEIYEQLDFNEAPIEKVYTCDNKPLIINIPLDDHIIHVSVWQLKVGKTAVYLLDTNIDENSPSDRNLSARLYTDDREKRLMQEIVIGIGGVRVLRALNISPCLWHANEGHTVFMTFERIREYITQGNSFSEAVEKVKSTTIFTTHTPVPAGNDVFPIEMVKKYLNSFLNSTDIDNNELISFGIQEFNNTTAFSMTALGMRLSSMRNAVSQLHGQTCKKLWQVLWPNLNVDEVPITYITNGIHIPTWVSPQFNTLFTKYIGPGWIEKQDDPTIWQKVMDIPDEEIWSMRRWLKYKLVRAIEDRIRERWAETSLDPSQAIATGALIDTEFLTIGFCRRATEYKRATLIFSDLPRLKAILKNIHKPVQLVFAGKAHPNDIVGKYIIQQIYRLAADPDLEGRIAFVENYDMHMARYLVQGIDVWLNNPRWFEEASGTSGMKSCLNGGLHLSVLDGWWYEGYNGSNGWAIENKSTRQNNASDDKSDAEQIYQLLEEKIVPLFYERDINGIPHRWIQLIKESIRSIVPFFNTRRMLKEYLESIYLPTIKNCYQFHEHKITDRVNIDYSI